MANNIAVKDAGGATQTVKTTDNAGVHTPHHNVDALPALPAGTNNIGDVDVLTLPALPAGSNLIGQVTALGGAAHDAAVSGNPVLNAGFASAAAPGNVSADGDAVRLWALRNGALAVNVTAAGALIGGDAANGLDVDVTRLPKPGTGTRSQVADSATDVQILAANASRLGASVFNDSSATLHLGLGTATVTASNYTVKVASGGYYELPSGFTGELRGLWASDPNDGGAKVTELT
jgi:hypothetical protein